MKTKGWVCPMCVDKEGMPMEFKSFEEYQAHNKKYHPEGGNMPIKEEKTEKEPLKPLKPPIQERGKIKPKEIKLIYKYIGSCPNCGAELETIPLDIKDKNLIVIAWCPNCKEVKSQKEVAKL
jgi:hypothetical protein